MVKGIPLIVAAAVGVSAWAQAGGGIQGVVTEEGGRAVGRVYVVYTRTAGSGSATSESYGVKDDGAFEFSGLAPGTYSLCIQSPGLEFLDPCLWSDQPPTVRVTGGQIARNVRLAAQRAVRLRVRVDDPERRLAAPGRESASGNFDAGIWTSRGLYVPLRLTAKEASGRTLELAVPANQSLHLSLTSTTVGFTDGAGRQLERRRTSVAVRTPKDTTEMTVQFAARAYRP